MTGIFKEPLDRQIMEKVQISNIKADILINRKNQLTGALLEREQFKYKRGVQEDKGQLGYNDHSSVTKGIFGFYSLVVTRTLMVSKVLHK